MVSSTLTQLTQHSLQSLFLAELLIVKLQAQKLWEESEKMILSMGGFTASFSWFTTNPEISSSGRYIPRESGRFLR